MDEKTIQEFFRYTDDADTARLERYLHPELVVSTIGIEGVDQPFDLPSYLKFLEENVAYRSERGERTEHVPTHVKIGGAFIAIRGYLKITSPEAADEYHRYTDVLKLQDGKIREYNIAYDI
jgi:hypothetical protein